MATPIDPVCGMKAEGPDVQQQQYDGETFFFCGRECVKKFEKDPARYAKGHMKGQSTGQQEARR